MPVRECAMIADRQYDVAIIGTGAGGGTLAAKLAPSGLKILLIERGDFVPIGIKLNEADRMQSPCIRCNTCDGFACLVDAKADADIIGVRPALAYPNVTLVTNMKVTRLDTDSSGRQVTEIVAMRGETEERFSADVVVVAAGAVNSAALLLRSASDAQPNGLANRSDQVGRHYMHPNNS